MHPSDRRWDTLRAGLVGALVAAVVIVSFPVAAAVGDSLRLGAANSANAVTSLSGTAAANLRITNSQTGSPALDLRVVRGAPPLKVNSDSRVTKLNSDLLDGKHATYFLPATGTAADSSLLEGRASTAYQGAPCPPGRDLVGFDRSGPRCTDPRIGRVQLDYAGDVGWDPSLVLDASGYPVVAYYDNTNHDLKLAYCADASCSDWTFTVVDSTGDVGERPSLVLDASGYPVIAYYDATNGDLKLAHCGNATCTSGNSILAVDTTGTVGEGASLTLDMSGYPVIAANKAGGSVRLVRCGNANCTNRVTNTVRASGVMTSTPALGMSDTWDDPIIAYTLSNTDLVVLHCGNDDCSSGNTETVVVSGTFAYLSMVLDAFGNPVIAYQANTGASSQLNVIRCNAADCTTSNTTNVAYSFGGGFYPSLVLDEDGIPIISHQDQTGDGSALVTYCGNSTCSGANNTIWAGDSGFSTSLVLDASDHPIITFYDHLYQDLRLVGIWLRREEFPGPIL